MQCGDVPRLSRLRVNVTEPDRGLCDDREIDGIEILSEMFAFVPLLHDPVNDGERQKNNGVGDEQHRLVHE